MMKHRCQQFEIAGKYSNIMFDVDKFLGIIPRMEESFQIPNNSTCWLLNCVYNREPENNDTDTVQK